MTNREKTIMVIKSLVQHFGWEISASLRDMEAAINISRVTIARHISKLDNLGVLEVTKNPNAFPPTQSISVDPEAYEMYLDGVLL